MKINNSKIIKLEKQDDEAISGDLAMDKKTHDRFYSPPVEQDAEIREYVQTRTSEILEMRMERDRPYEHFGLLEDGTSSNIIKYINESEKRMNGTLERSDFKDDWQANIFDHVTRNKTMQILARLTAQRMKTFFFNNKGVRSSLAVVMSNLYESNSRGRNGLNKGEVFLFQSMFESILKGTVIREIKYFEGKRRVKTTKGKNGKWNYKNLFEYEDVLKSVMPLEHFIPGDVKKFSIAQMSKCATEEPMSLDSFIKDYSSYKGYSNVRPVSFYSDAEQTRFELKQATDQVLVRRYFNKNTDVMDIIANGHLLTEIGDPLPNKHKQLPFIDSKFEILSNNFFYGMSLAFKLASYQDMNNSLLNMMLDQIFISLKSPIFNASGSEIDLDWMYPSNVIDIDPDSDVSKIREFKTQPETGAAASMLNIIQARMNASSVSGQSEREGTPPSAEEVATVREASMDIMDLFLKQMEWSEEDVAEQTMQIMLEKYPGRLKSSGKHRKFVIDNVRTLTGELGTMEVNIRKEPRSKGLLNKINLGSDKTSQIVDIPMEAIMDFRGMVKVVPNASIKETQAQTKRAEIEWNKITSQNQYVNQKENIKDLAEAYGKDPSKLILDAPEEIPGQEKNDVRGPGLTPRGGSSAVTK